MGTASWLAPLAVLAAAGLPSARTGAPIRDVYADTWVATDGLGRAVPTFEQVGPPRRDRTAAIFYFLWLGQHSRTGPWDITRILAAHPEARRDSAHPAWGPLSHFHHWGEPLFGYYVSDDRWVIRKHAGLLAAAGVDALVFDTTNNFTYDRCWTALGDTLEDARRLGNPIPSLAFLGPFGDANSVAQRLYTALYGPGRYSDLWFRWDGKPLLLASPGMIRDEGLSSAAQDGPARLEPGHSLSQSFTSPEPIYGAAGCLPTWATAGSSVTLRLRRGGPDGPEVASRRVRDHVDNAWARIDLPSAQPPGRYTLEISEPAGVVGWWTNSAPTLADAQAYADGRPVAGTRTISVFRAGGNSRAILDFFTFRTPVASYFTGPSAPDQWGWLEVSPQHVFRNSRGEAELVTVGVAQNAVDGKLSALSEERSLGRSYSRGSWDRTPGAVATGRNFAEQWERALKLDPRCVFITGWNEWVAQRFDTNGRPTFVDQFDQEGSRDIEPMRGGHGDSYYYQLVSNIRRYKGVRPIPKVRSRSITIDGRFADWHDVQPEFRDFAGDAVRRDHPSWAGDPRLVNETARNDIVAAKVSVATSGVCFYARARQPLSPPAGRAWMLLFIDADRNPRTGWMGYEVVVGRGGPRRGTTSVERCVGTSYRWAAAGRARAAISGAELEIAVPHSALGWRARPTAFDFKWADNIRETGDWSDFYENGDAAPDARFNYRAVLRAR